MSMALGGMFGGDEDAFEDDGFSDEHGWVVAAPSADPELRLRTDNMAAALEGTAHGSDEQLAMSRELFGLRNELAAAEASRTRDKRSAAEDARVESLTIGERQAEEAERERLSQQDKFAGEGEGEVVYMAGEPVQVYQTGWHPLNANRVWEGNTAFSAWIVEKWNSLDGAMDGPVLELGAATGALAAWLVMRGVAMTSTDAADDGSMILSQVKATFSLNGLAPPAHVEHNWGGTVPTSLLNFPLIIANDVLLYVAAYPLLVETLRQMLARRGSVKPRLIMHWDRRGTIEMESRAFFELLGPAGLRWVHLGRKVFEITSILGGPTPMRVDDDVRKRAERALNAAASTDASTS
jgi:hypothetical protein